ICGQPRVLFLDEPSVGLDVQAREVLWASIRGLLATGCSIVLTTHYLEEAEALADRVAVIAKGRLVASGSVDEMRALVARRQVSCETRLDEAEVAAWPGVQEVRRERNRLHLTAIDAERVVRRLLDQDPALSRLEVREAGLNEAFNTLTKEAACTSRSRPISCPPPPRAVCCAPTPRSSAAMRWAACALPASPSPCC